MSTLDVDVHDLKIVSRLHLQCTEELRRQHNELRDSFNELGKAVIVVNQCHAALIERIQKLEQEKK